MSNCRGCELLPSPLPADGILCLWPPLGHTLSKLRAAFAARGIAAEVNSSDCLTVPVSTEAFQTLRDLAADLSEVERSQCKYLTLPTGCQPTLSDFGRVNALTHLIAHISGRWLVEMLVERRLTSTVAAIQDTQLPPENFIFEVVESDRVTDIERLPKILDYYRGAGFRVALDDLGAGYSSLNMLSILRPDFIKLDMQLIRGIDCDPYKGEVVGKLIESAHNLDIQVIAEGVETVGEWNWASIHGADYTQGYLFGKPSAEPQASYAIDLTAV